MKTIIKEGYRLRNHDDGQITEPTLSEKQAYIKSNIPVLKSQFKDIHAEVPSAQPGKGNLFNEQLYVAGPKSTIRSSSELDIYNNGMLIQGRFKELNLPSYKEGFALQKEMFAAYLTLPEEYRKKKDIVYNPSKPEEFPMSRELVYEINHLSVANGGEDILEKYSKINPNKIVVDQVSSLYSNKNAFQFKLNPKDKPQELPKEGIYKTSVDFTHNVSSNLTSIEAKYNQRLDNIQNHFDMAKNEFITQYPNLKKEISNIPSHVLVTPPGSIGFSHGKNIELTDSKNYYTESLHTLNVKEAYKMTAASHVFKEFHDLKFKSVDEAHQFNANLFTMLDSLPKTSKATILETISPNLAKNDKTVNDVNALYIKSPHIIQREVAEVINSEFVKNGGPDVLASYAKGESIKVDAPSTGKGSPSLFEKVKGGMGDLDARLDKLEKTFANPVFDNPISPGRPKI